MTPDQIKPGHMYELKHGEQWTVIAVDEDVVIFRRLGATALESIRRFASLCVRDVTPAPESDQCEKVAQAQSQGASRGSECGAMPCPFCGSDETDFDGSAIECLVCGVVGPSLPDDDDLTDAEVITAWNRRTPPAAVVNAELLEAARAVASQIDYLQGLWGREAITQRLVDQMEAAIARAETANDQPRFRHRRTGDIYELLLISNEHADRTAQYPPTAVYRRVSDQTVWSRPVQDWGKDFDEVSGE